MPLSPAVLQYFATHQGVASAAQLANLGLSPDEIRGLADSGVCIRVRRGLYKFRGMPECYEQRCALTCAASDTATISHPTAGRLWDWRRCYTERIHATIEPHTRRKLPGVVIHRSNLVAADIVKRPDGIRLTSPTRTLFDLASILSRPDLESVLEQALRMGLTDLGKLEQIRTRLSSPGRKGSALFGQLLDGRSTAKSVDSHLELLVERALIAAGVPRPIRQQCFVVDDGTAIHVDFYWPEFALVLEVDHDEWHGSRRDRARDKWRDRQLKRQGIDTIRVTDTDVQDRMRRVIDDVRVIIAGRFGVL